jgi:hypothetical protein
MASYMLKFAADFIMAVLLTLYAANAWGHKLGNVASGIIFVKWDPQE